MNESFFQKITGLSRIERRRRAAASRKDSFYFLQHAMRRQDMDRQDSAPAAPSRTTGATAFLRLRRRRGRRRRQQRAAAAAAVAVAVGAPRSGGARSNG